MNRRKFVESLSAAIIGLPGSTASIHNSSSRTIERPEREACSHDRKATGERPPNPVSHGSAGIRVAGVFSGRVFEAGRRSNLSHECTSVTGVLGFNCLFDAWPRKPQLQKPFLGVAKFPVEWAGEGGLWTVFPLPTWGQQKVSLPEVSQVEIHQMMKRYRDEICKAALTCYADGADGISTFNWSGYSQYSSGSKRLGTKLTQYRGSLPYMTSEQFVHQFLRTPECLRGCLKKEPKVRLHCEWAG